MPSTSAKQAKFMRAIAHSPSFAKKVGVPQKVGKDFEMADKKARKFGDGGATASKLKPKPKDTSTDTNGLNIPSGGYNDPYEPTPKTGPDTPPRKPLGPAGKKGYAKGGKAFRAVAPKGALAKRVMPSASARRPVMSAAMSPTRADISAIRGNMDTGAGISTPPQFAKGGKAMKKCYDNGGEAKGGKMDVEGKREIAFMKAKKAPKSMISAEKREEGMRKGGKMKKYAKGGGGVFRSVADGIAKKGKTKAMMPKMADGGEARGGRAKKRGGKC